MGCLKKLMNLEKKILIEKKLKVTLKLMLKFVKIQLLKLKTLLMV